MGISSGTKLETVLNVVVPIIQLRIVGTRNLSVSNVTVQNIAHLNTGSTNQKPNRSVVTSTCLYTTEKALSRE